MPWFRQSSPDGRYLFTLYITNTGKAMVHQLDVRAGVAKCIDLPGSGDFNSGTSYTLTASPDGRTLWAVATGYGKVVAIDVAGARVRETFDFQPTTAANPTSGVAGGGSRRRAALQVYDRGTLWFVSLRQARVEMRPRVSIALGFAPDGKTLWTLGQKSRVTSVPVP